LHQTTYGATVRFVKKPARLEASMTFQMPTLRIDLTNEEILDDLLYPGRPEGGAR
jgi:hypothetical protein